MLQIKPIRKLLRRTSEISSKAKIVISTVIVAVVFLISVGVVIQLSMTSILQGLEEINRAELTELARQIALTLDATLDPGALTNASRMQKIVDQNMKARRLNADDNLLIEMRIHAPDPTSSVGYRAIAGSSPDLIGQESDPEDIEAVRKGELVVVVDDLNGTPILDITSPLHVNGVAAGTAGIKMSMVQGISLINAIGGKSIHSLQFTSGAIVLIVVLMSLTMAAFMLRDNSVRLRLEKKLHEQANTDELTGLFNRRMFLESAESELKRAKRFHHPMAIVMLDIDRFKHINDHYGHATGDGALVAIANICQKNIRETDILARLGGDEFVLILPETESDKAYIVMERCRKLLAEHPVEIDGQQVALSMSVGIACLADDDTQASLLHRADQALYKAKEGGRNQVFLDQAQSIAA